MISQYTPEMLHSYLSKVCETDRRKLKSKVVLDLQFYCKITKDEATEIWNEGVKQGALSLITHWELNPDFQTFDYHEQQNAPQPEILHDSDTTDPTDKGMSTTYHNTRTPESLMYGKYGNTSVHSILKRKNKTKA